MNKYKNIIPYAVSMLICAIGAPIAALALNLAVLFVAWVPLSIDTIHFGLLRVSFVVGLAFGVLVCIEFHKGEIGGTK